MRARFVVSLAVAVVACESGAGPGAGGTDSGVADAGGGLEGGSLDAGATDTSDAGVVPPSPKLTQMIPGEICSVDRWCLVAPRPLITDVYGLGGVLDDQWILARGHTLVRHTAAGFSGLWGLDGLNEASEINYIGPDDVWLGGYRFHNGRLEAPPAANPGRASFVSSTLGWAVGAGGVYRWNGTAWVSLGNLGVPLSFTAVSAASASDVWVAAGPILKHWDGSVWTDAAVPLPTGFSVTSLRAFGTNDVWAFGAGARYHFDGVSWEGARDGSEVFPAPVTLMGSFLAPPGVLTGLNADRLYMGPCSTGTQLNPVPTGACNVGLQFSNGHYWLAGTYDVQAAGHGAPLRDASLSYLGKYPESTAIHAPLIPPEAIRGEPMAGTLEVRIDTRPAYAGFFRSTAPGSWETVPLEVSIAGSTLPLVAEQLAVTSPTRAWILARYLDQANYVVRYDGTASVYDLLPGHAIQLAVKSSTDAYALLDGAKRAHFDGTAWSVDLTLPTPPGDKLALAGEEVLAYQKGGPMFRSQGATWIDASPPPLTSGGAAPLPLRHAFDNANMDLDVLFSDGVVRRRSAGSWQIMAQGFSVEAEVLYTDHARGRFWARTPMGPRMEVWFAAQGQAATVQLVWPEQAAMLSEVTMDRRGASMWLEASYSRGGRLAFRHTLP